MAADDSRSARGDSQERVEQFYKSLSPRSKLRLLAAIFLMFAPVELVSSGLTERGPWWLVAARIALSGSVAVGWALAAIHSWRLLAFVIPAGIGAYLLLQRFRPPADPDVTGLGFLCVGLIGFGYVLFISFVNREGVRAVELQTEISLAGHVHRQLVPPIERVTEHLELFGRSVASTEVGGDLVDVVRRGDRCLLCVADVVGHGVAAGIVMAMVKSGLCMNAADDDAHPKLLDGLDRVLSDLGDDRIFVTAACVEVQPSSARYAIAGHLPILHYRASDAAVHRLSNGGLPLGINRSVREGDGASYSWHRVELGPGDVLALLTDGFTEVLDAEGRELGLQPFEALLRDHSRAPLSEMYARMLAMARRHGQQLDDQTVLLVRRVAATTPPAAPGAPGAPRA